MFWEHELLISPKESKQPSPNTLQLSVLTSFNLIWFHACSHYRPDKTATLSNICLLGRPVDYSFSWRSDGTRLTQLHNWANKSISPAIMSNCVCFKFNSRLYEVQFCVNYASTLSHRANCACFREEWPSCDLSTYCTLLPAALWIAEMERLKAQAAAQIQNLTLQPKRKHSIRNSA